MTKRKPKSDPNANRGKGKDKYPTPKKDEKLQCLGCGGRGVVPHKFPNVFKECGGCKGLGYIKAK